jgi:hypothetical protein
VSNVVYNGTLGHSFSSSIHRTTVITYILIFWQPYGCAVVFRYERIIVEQPDCISYIPIASLFHRRRTISLCVVLHFF